MRLTSLAGLGVAVLVLLILSLPVSPSSGLRQGKYTYNPPPLQDHIAGVSQSAYLSYYLQHPEQATAELRPAVAALLNADSGFAQDDGGSSALSEDAVIANGRFNKEDGGPTRSMPQNEESVTFCANNTNEVLMGTNDYRGIFAGGNMTGWHFSTNGGASVLNEGLMESVNTGSTDVPSRGDPVVRSLPASSGCNYYAAGIAVNANGSNLPSAIAVYSSNSAALTTCSPSCWPQKLAVASSNTDFLDKEWMDVGSDGAGGNVLWVAWTRFQNYGGAGGHSPIEASRCIIQGGSGLVSSCTAPLAVSPTTADGQYPYVTMAPDGRVYITWIEVSTGPSGDIFTIFMRSAAPGSVALSDAVIVYQEQHALGFNTTLSQNDFRITTIPVATVLDLGSTNRLYITWAFCQQAVRVSVVDTCRDADIKVSQADDGQPFTAPTVIAQPGSQYFPSIDADNAQQRILLAFYSNQADPWNHRQQIMIANGPPDLSSLAVTAINPKFQHGDLDCDHFVGIIDMIRGLLDIGGVTPLPPGCPVDLNEPDADPFLGGLFIGDYIEVTAENGLAYIGYTANFTKLNFLGTGPALYQQDNYLAKFTYP